MAGVGLFGFWGGAGDIVGAAQGLGILMLAAGCVLVGRVHAKHHGPGPTRTFHGPRAVLGACLAVAPLALFVTLPASTPSSAIAILAVVFGGMFYAVVRLEDEEAARRPASPRKAGPVATYPEVTTHESPDGADDRRH
ncbi:hypothetical protein ACFQRD_06155 [Brachybacterium sp. GCM10030268]|uniref:hypothetical protein n=1 Tax=Brachybacterium sp. GCM10030268 TaxID=3273382 RepID=UPI0036189E52